MATLELLMDEIWQHIGEPTDLDPDTDVSYSGSPLLMWVCNEAQRRIAAWKDPANGRQIRIRSLISDMYFASKYYSGDTLDADGTTTTVVLPNTDVVGGAATYDNCYNGWVLQVNNENRIITDYDGASYTATVHEAYSTAPATDDDYLLCKNFYYLMPSTHDWVSLYITSPATTDLTRATGNLLEVLKIVDLTNEVELEKARGSYFPLTGLTSPGDPSMWWRVGNKILFDVPQDSAISFYMEYYRSPLDMAGNSSEPEIPEQYHYAIVLWGMWWGFNRQQDYQAAWAKKQDWIEFLRSTKSEYDVEMERAESFGSLQRS